ncbi:glycosyltransferase family 2 protein [Chengkuizengella axinellae]|uniref:Glycosyltransferase family A protein n=1 Tax=Chengkuizengella axinellae TaxID=3064388 RepID=A0ABT9J1L8_9BACL|nr:glycosyltransferase family A protein [Chengkuizengella sp. 2205SS18-9]MDP5275509.1 glycosyltransferase family A protein [Chengkuizengella sp. 2205SS18-9]
MKNSVVVRCYNTLPLIKKCVEAVINTTDLNTEIILINNHPPYQDVMEYLQNLKRPRVKVLDPGKNIGGIEGFNYGASKASGEYLVVLDDDIIVPNNNWIEVMAQSLNEHPNLAYVSLAWSEMININANSLDQFIQKPEYTMKMMKDVVILGCTMIKKSLWNEHFNIKEPLHWYGTDLKYKRKAAEKGMDTGMILSHMVEHLARTEQSDPLYGVWKVIYTEGLTQKNYKYWKENKNSLTPVEECELIQFGYPKSQIIEIEHLLKQ